jgi:hypothetical protein
MNHASSSSIIPGRGDVVTRFILLLSADAYATARQKLAACRCHSVGGCPINKTSEQGGDG